MARGRVVAKPDYRYLEEGTYIIVTRARSLGETQRVLVYSKSYARIWRYWLTNPDDLPDRDGWQIVRRINGCNVVIKPIPPNRLKQNFGNLVAVMAVCYLVLDGMDGKIDGIVHMCRILLHIHGFVV